jgi:hypothetical protein
MLDEFAKQLRDDPELTWCWHCNIAMIAIDSGADSTQANDRTADFMMQAFGVDTRSYLLMLRAPPPKEPPAQCRGFSVGRGLCRGATPA